MIRTRMYNWVIGQFRSEKKSATTQPAPNIITDQIYAKEQHEAMSKAASANKYHAVIQQAKKVLSPAFPAMQQGAHKKGTNVYLDRMLFMYGSALIQGRQNKEYSWNDVDPVMATIRTMAAKKTYASSQNYFNLKQSSAELYYATVKAQIGVRDEQAITSIKDWMKKGAAAATGKSKNGLDIEHLEKFNTDTYTFMPPIRPGAAGREAEVEYFARVAHAQQVLAEHYRMNGNDVNEKKALDGFANMRKLTVRGDASYAGYMDAIANALKNENLFFGFKARYFTQSIVSDTSYRYGVKENNVPFTVEGNTIKNTKDIATYDLSAPITWRPRSMPLWAFTAEPGVELSTVKQEQVMNRFVRADGATIPDRKGEQRYESTHNTYAPYLNLSAERTLYEKHPLALFSKDLTLKKMSWQISQGVKYYEDLFTPQFYSGDYQLPVSRENMRSISSKTTLSAALELSPRGYEDIFAIHSSVGAFALFEPHTDGVAFAPGSGSTEYRAVGRVTENTFGAFWNVAADMNLKNWYGRLGYNLNYRLSPIRDYAKGEVTTSDHIFEHTIPLSLGFQYRSVDGDWGIKVGPEVVFKPLVNLYDRSWKGIDVPSGDPYGSKVQSIGVNLVFSTRSLGEFNVNAGLRQDGGGIPPLPVSDAVSNTSVFSGRASSPYIQFGWTKRY